jgi:hypothetical protein
LTSSQSSATRLGVAQGADEAEEQQGLVPGAGEVRLGVEEDRNRILR